MPKTLGGLLGFVVMAVVTVALGLYIINRVQPLANIVNAKAA